MFLPYTHIAAGVRTAAIEVMGSLYHQIGPKLLAFAISDEVRASN